MCMNTEDNDNISIKSDVHGHIEPQNVDHIKHYNFLPQAGLKPTSSGLLD